MAQLSTKLPWELANPKWASQLNPILAIPMLSGVAITDIGLSANVPRTINHLLQRNPQGWFLIDNTADTAVWRTKAFNNTTITLEASADTIISFWIF